MSSILKKTICTNYQILAKRTFCSTQVNYLYSPARLGMDSYLQSRAKTQTQFSSLSDQFIEKMTNSVADSKQMIFTEDLKNAMHLVNKADMELVTNMIRKFNLQKTEFRFGSFIFGPVVMRMFYYLDAPKDALKSFEDPANETFYDQHSTYLILLDMLYNHKMYEEMFAVFEKVKERQVNMTKYPKYCSVLIFAACYKQNSKESFEYASKLWTDMINSGAVPVRRSIALVAALALSQKHPDVALEILSVTNRQSYVTIRNIKARALVDVGRFDQTLMLLNSVLEENSMANAQHTFFEETMLHLRKVIEESKNEDLLKQFVATEVTLRKNNLIDANTLESLLTSEIGLTYVIDSAKKGNYQNFTQKTNTFNAYAKKKTMG